MLSQNPNPRITITTEDGRKFEVQFNEPVSNSTERNFRVFTLNSPQPKMEHPPFRQAVDETEESLFESQWKGYNKESISIRREIVNTVLTVIGMDPKGFTFSQKAACKCGCSPSFNKKTVPYQLFGRYYREIFITSVKQ